MASSIPSDDPWAVDVVAAIRKGDLDRLRHLLDERPELANTRLVDASNGATKAARTLLHVVTDWPGHYPNGAETARLLVSAGADPNARFEGPHTETPLHWAASSDDVEVLDALLDTGADIDAGGAVIAGGSPLMDAAAFGQWNAARRLLERGATAGLWEAAAMGLADRVDQCLGAVPPPSQEDITGAFWGACHGGQLATARRLLDAGADPNWIGWDQLTPSGAAERSGATHLVDWLRSLNER